ARLVGRETSAPKRRLMHVANLTLPGVPDFYYGEELEMQDGDGSSAVDEKQRTPMAWDTSDNAGFTTGTPWFTLAPGWETTNVATAAADPRSVYNLVRGLTQLRVASVALREGTIA